MQPLIGNTYRTDVAGAFATRGEDDGVGFRDGVRTAVGDGVADRDGDADGDGDGEEDGEDDGEREGDGGAVRAAELVPVLQAAASSTAVRAGRALTRPD